MESYIFCKKKTLKVTSDKIINYIYSNLKNLNIEINEKNYKFLDNISINYLKNNEHYVTYTTFGQKYLLYLTKYNNKNTCFFINKKSNLVIYCRFRFKDYLFNETIFEGELLKYKNDSNWLFSITDILLHNNNILNKIKFDEKINLMKNIFENDYIEDLNINICNLYLNKYFNYNNIKDLYENYIPHLNFNCSGLLFKSKISNEKGLLYIFLENRNKKKIQNENIINNNTIISNNNTIISNNNTNISNNNTNTLRSLLLKKTDLPDVYELYCSKDKELYKIGIASITSLNHSIYIKNLFTDSIEIYMYCEYVSKFNKWKPINISNSIDDYSLFF